MKRTGSIMRRIVLALCMVLLLAWFGGINVDKVQAASNDKGMKDFVTRLYSVCLGRNPDTAGLNDWVKQLKNGMSGADVAAGFIFSNEFMSKNLCDSCYVTSLYQCFLGRQPDSVGKADWMKRLQEGRTRGWVFNGFVGSQEFSKICESYGIVRGNGDWSGRTVIVTGDCALCGSHNKSASDFVTRLYNVCLDRNPDEAGLSSWINALKTGSTGAEVASGFVFSKEFQNKNLCNDHFVEYMYKAFFNRGADPEGKASWLGVLNKGGTKGDVFAGFVGSQEFAKLCISYGIQPGDGNQYRARDFKSSGTCAAEVKVKTLQLSGSASHEHTFSGWQTVKAATCTASGTRKRTCTGCGASETQPIAATGHSYDNWAVTKAATCAAEGVETRTCKVCKHQETRTVAKLTAHSYDNWAVAKAATCAAEGIETRTCNICGYQETRTVAKLTAHSYGDWVVTSAATCAVEGTEERTCNVCGQQETKTIPMLTTHAFGEWVKKNDATCSHPGAWARECADCGKVEYKYDPALPHTLKDLGEIPATCTTRGRHESECTVCGQKFFSYTTYALGHEWEDHFTVDVEATCTKDGSQSIHCKHDGCNERLKTEVIPKYGAHEWQISETVEATCDTDGYTLRTCQKCGEEKRTIINATGHEWGGYVVTQARDCVNDGMETRTCDVCGATETRVFASHYGGEHEMVEVPEKEATCTEAGWSAYQKCSRCGYKAGYVEIPAFGHDYDDDEWYVHADWNARNTWDDPRKDMNKNTQAEGEVYNGIVKCAPVIVYHKCKRCSDGVEMVMMPGTGHTWSDGGEGIGDKAYCTKCGLDTTRWTYTSGPSGDVNYPDIDQDVDRYRVVWGITYIVDQNKSEGIQNSYNNLASCVTKTIIGKGDSQKLKVAAPKAKPGYVFVGWRQVGVDGAPLEPVREDGVRYDSWRNLDKTYEAVFIRDGESIEDLAVPKSAVFEEAGENNNMLESAIPAVVVLVVVGSVAGYHFARRRNKK